MTLNEIFGDWLKCIDIEETVKVKKALMAERFLTPDFSNVFKAFQSCPYSEFRVLILGQDPYPQPKVATGLAFANDNTANFTSPSLEIIKNSIISLDNSGITPKFAPDLMPIAKQGVLWLNSSLTCKIYEPESHKMIWRQWIKYTLTRIGEYNPGLVCVLFGRYAQSFERYLGPFKHIFKEEHPASLARKGETLRSSLWTDINEILVKQNNSKINWFNYEQESY